jgi:hypothetical protein
MLAAIDYGNGMPTRQNVRAMRGISDGSVDVLGQFLLADSGVIEGDQQARVGGHNVQNTF